MACWELACVKSSAACRCLSATLAEQYPSASNAKTRIRTAMADDDIDTLRDLLVVLQQRHHIVILEPVAAFQKLEFDHKSQAGNPGSQRFRQFRRRLGRPSRRQ